MSPQAKRNAVRHLMVERDYSQRRACQLVGISRSSVRYQPVPKPEEMVLREQVRDHGTVGKMRLAKCRRGSRQGNLLVLGIAPQSLPRPVTFRESSRVLVFSERRRPRRTDQQRRVRHLPLRRVSSHSRRQRDGPSDKAPVGHRICFVLEPDRVPLCQLVTRV